MFRFIIATILSPPTLCYAQCDNNDLHLVVMSGQSSMVWVQQTDVEANIGKKVGTDNFLVVKHAVGGQTIDKWDETLIGTQYAAMMLKVWDSLQGRSPTTVTFAWHQGSQMPN